MERAKKYSNHCYLYSIHVSGYNSKNTKEIADLNLTSAYQQVEHEAFHGPVPNLTDDLKPHFFTQIELNAVVNVGFD